MSYEFEYRVPVSERDLSRFIKGVVESSDVGPKFEDFSLDTSIESHPMVGISMRVEDWAEEDIVISGIKRCSYDSLSFNITG